MTAENTLSTVAQFSFVITASVTVVGWYIVARQNDRREFRKEVREQIKLCQERVQKVRDGAAKYWLHSGPKAASPAATELKSDLMSLSRQLRALSSQGVVVDPNLVAAIRSAATGGDFEKRDRKKTSNDIDRVVEVTELSEDLLTSIDVEFYKRFPPYRKSRWGPFLAGSIIFSLYGDRPS